MEPLPRSGVGPKSNNKFPGGTSLPEGAPVSGLGGSMSSRPKMLVEFLTLAAGGEGLRGGMGSGLSVVTGSAAREAALASYARENGPFF